MKLENLLMDDTKNIKIIDFGFSIILPPDKKLNIFCGTPSKTHSSFLKLILFLFFVRLYGT